MTVPGNLAHDNVRQAVHSNEMIRISMAWLHGAPLRSGHRSRAQVRIARSSMRDRETDLLHDPATE
ncbi:hypothetical protein E4U60_000155 [Claviceps pazoutovae]|uniref:Uncharacterized protein n=1 Tax=Claviceps pazoutovae TaxID=1649127 RepID=A0A9P7MEW1_9HYPO|nr:hypothetical protein E4U60_000155 [Claviceps pazoutovae]